MKNDFYVDDGLTSCPTSKEAIRILKDTQSALKEFGNLRLHKFASNSPEVMMAFQNEDLATNLKDLDLHGEDKPLQRSLGLGWDVNSDTFLFQLSKDIKPDTRRGVLSTINGIYDPFGFLAPVTMHGKLLLRKLIAQTQDWDEPLPDDLAALWNSWKNTLSSLEDLRIPRTYVKDLSKAVTKELHIFSDASEKAIGAVIYLRAIDSEGQCKVGFVMGKAKVAPTTGHTIPRLELCASVLAVEMSQFVVEHLDTHIDSMKYYTDSKVVLGYICNESRRFFIYVANRVERIRRFTTPSQWNYVPTDRNPADLATRCLPADELRDSVWLKGPKHLLVNDQEHETSEHEHLLIDPNEDKEIRPTCLKTECKPWLNTKRFERFSDWNRMVEGVALLKRFVAYRKQDKSLILQKSLSYHQKAENFIIKAVQKEVYADEIACLRSNQPLPKNSSILTLRPFIDNEGILRVGGRLRHSQVDTIYKNPILVPGKHHIATLLVRRCHQLVAHQGRHFTEGKIRSMGYWITGAKRLVSSIIHNCFICRKLRGKTQYQVMADLPADRLDPSPPFTNVGVDAFGPWAVVTRKTRGGSAN